MMMIQVQVILNSVKDKILPSDGAEHSHHPVLGTSPPVSPCTCSLLAWRMTSHMAHHSPGVL